MKKESFLQGIVILALAGIASKVLGVINKMIVAYYIGEEGVGLYMMAYPTLLLIVTLTQLGLPIAISKMVAEAETLESKEKVRQVLSVSFVIVGLLSIFFTTLSILVIPFISEYLFTDARVMYPLLAIIPIVPVVAMASVIRGYFQGLSKMKPYAWSQIIEQSVRLVLVMLFVKWLLPYGIEYAASGAMIAGVVGETVSLIYMWRLFKKEQPFALGSSRFLKKIWHGPTAKDLMSIALPTTGSRLIGSVSYFIEPIIVVQSLALAGATTALATRQYGELAGFAIPLLTLPSFITHALHISLVPAISEAVAKQQNALVHYRLNQALKIAALSGGLTMIIAYLFAEPLMTLMYHAPQAAQYIFIMAPFFMFYYFQGPLQAVLQALDLAKAGMMNTLFGSIIKTLVIFILGSQPAFGIMGAALGYAVSCLLTTVLHFATVVKSVGYSFKMGPVIKIIFIMGITFIAGYYCNQHLFLSLGLFPRTALLIFGIVFLYGFLMIIFRLVHREEIIHLPIIKKWLA